MRLGVKKFLSRVNNSVCTPSTGFKSEDGNTKIFPQC